MRADRSSSCQHLPNFCSVCFFQRTHSYTNVHPFSCLCAPPDSPTTVLHPALCLWTLTYMDCIKGLPCPLAFCWGRSMGVPTGDWWIDQRICSSSSLPVGCYSLTGSSLEVPHWSMLVSLNSAHFFVKSPFIQLQLPSLSGTISFLQGSWLIDTISNQENHNEIVSLRSTSCLNSFSYSEVLNSHKFGLKSRIPRFQ